MGNQKITASMIVEVVGRPPEYLKEALGSHIDKINQIEKTSLNSVKIAEPRIIEGEEDFYSCFGEVEVEVPTLGKLMDLVFDFMPSSVEIIDPSDLEFDCQEATMFLNDLAGRLHKYDEVAKVAKAHIDQLNQKLQVYQAREKKIQESPIRPLKISMNAPEKKEEPKDTVEKPKKETTKKSKKKSKKKN